MWLGVRPAVFGEIFSGKKYGGKTPVVRVPVARCPAVKWVDTCWLALLSAWFLQLCCEILLLFSVIIVEATLC